MHAETGDHSQPPSNASDASESMDARAQYAAICYRQTGDVGRPIEVLLITSRDTGRWVIPKGWPKRRKTGYEVARLEAWEEAGVRGRVWKSAWGHYTYPKKLDHGEIVPARVQVHLLDVRRMEDDFPERHQRKLRWFSPRVAASEVREPELQSLFYKLEQRASEDTARLATRSEG
jgi:8-oxo-dGTP pyrophosphatase MutT (NUDIX family)